MKPQLNNQVFFALATIAWANGVFAPEEREGILNAARTAGYTEPELAYLSKCIETPVALSSLALHRLNALDRVLVYAAAEWIACVDGSVDPSEIAALKALGDHLKVAEDVRATARNAVVEIAKLPHGNRPDRFDLVKLRELLERNVVSR